MTPSQPEPLDHGAAAAAFLEAVHAGDPTRAAELYDANPEVARRSLHVAAALGLEEDVRRHLAEDPDRVRELAGTPPADPLVWLCWSPFHGESAGRDEGLAAAAGALLDAGADPNARDGGPYRLPALYAVTGQRNAPRIARLLLEAGAAPDDGESVFHAAERFHEEALALLLAHGVDLDATGDWGNTPLYFLLRHWDVQRMPDVKRGLLWLLDHGADPDVRSGKERESALQVAARRGQHPDVVRLLLDRGADVHARRGDGRTAWTLARRLGHQEVVEVLEKAGAVPDPLTPGDELVAACARGEVDEAQRLASPDLLASMQPEELRLLPEAASEGRFDVVRACLAGGFPIDTPHEYGGTALHHAAIHGRASVVRELLDAGADFRLRDPEHRSTPLGWACFGADAVREAEGDYPATVRALLEAGARLAPDEHPPQHEAVRAALKEHVQGEAGR